MLDDCKMFALDKWRGKKCYMLGARKLQIAWGRGVTPWYWDFVSVAPSRFPEVAQLFSVCWFEIKGRIHTKQLSPNTTYGAYLVYKMSSSVHCSGFDITPVKVTVLEVDEEDEGPPRNNNHAMTINNFYLEPFAIREHLERVSRSPGEQPTDRGDGWMEVEMGKYRVGDTDSVSERAVVEMTMWEVEAGTGKSGLLVQSIDLRPLD